MFPWENILFSNETETSIWRKTASIFNEVVFAHKNRWKYREKIVIQKTGNILALFEFSNLWK